MFVLEKQVYLIRRTSGRWKRPAGEVKEVVGVVYAAARVVLEPHPPRRQHL